MAQKVNGTFWSFQASPKEQSQGKNKIINQICFVQMLCKIFAQVNKNSPSKTNTTWAYTYNAAEVMSSNPVQAWIFFRPYFHSCSRSCHYCKDHFHIHFSICSSHKWFRIFSYESKTVVINTFKVTQGVLSYKKHGQKVTDTQ